MTSAPAQPMADRYSLVIVPRDQSDLYNAAYYQNRGTRAVLVPRDVSSLDRTGSAPAEDAWTMLKAVAHEHGWTIGAAESIGSSILHWLSDGQTFGVYVEVNANHPAKKVTVHTGGGLVPAALEELRSERGHWYAFRTPNPSLEAALTRSIERQLTTVAQSLRAIMAELGKRIEAESNLETVEASSDAVDEARAVLNALGIRNKHLCGVTALRRAAEQMLVVRELLGEQGIGLSDIEAVALFQSL